MIKGRKHKPCGYTMIPSPATISVEILFRNTTASWVVSLIAWTDSSQQFCLSSWSQDASWQVQPGLGLQRNKARSAGRGWGPTRQQPAVEQEPEKGETECCAEVLGPKLIPGKISPQCSSNIMAPRKGGKWPWCGLLMLVITLHHHLGRD